MVFLLRALPLRIGPPNSVEGAPLVHQSSRPVHRPATVVRYDGSMDDAIYVRDFETLSTRLWQRPGVLSPHHPTPAPRGPGPEIGLLVAVFERALADLAQAQARDGGRNRRGARMAADAARWVSSAHRHPFSFEHISDSLRLDAQAVRRALRTGSFQPRRRRPPGSETAGE